MLSREQVLPELRAECAELKRAFEKPEPVPSFLDPDLILPFSAQDSAIAAKELSYFSWMSSFFLLLFICRYAAWRKKAHEALESKSDFEAVRQMFRARFLEVLCLCPSFSRPLKIIFQVTREFPERRLLVASAYYSACSDSTTNAFAFVCCFRELLRIKADALDKDISLSVPTQNFKTSTNLD
jgi:hypothetical protein